MTCGACVWWPARSSPRTWRSSGDWNYQGGASAQDLLRGRPTTPFHGAASQGYRSRQTRRRNVCQERGRTESLSDEIFDPAVLVESARQPLVFLRRPLRRPVRVFLSGGLRHRRAPRRARPSRRLAVVRARRLFAASRAVHRLAAIHVARRRRVGGQSLLHRRLRSARCFSSRRSSRCASRARAVVRRRALHGEAGAESVLHVDPPVRGGEVRPAALVSR